MVSGDNTDGQLWCSNEVEVSTKFIEATNFPFKDKISQISHVSAYNQSVAFALSDTQIAFRDSEKNITVFQTGIIKQICCAEKTVYVLCYDKRIYDCATKTYFEGTGYTQISNSDNFFCAIKSDGSAVIFEDGKPKTILESGVRIIGCTNEDIFLVTGRGVKRYSEGELHDVSSTKIMLSMSTSVTEAAFIDSNGGLWVYDSDALIQVFGLPPIVYCSVGIQHFAAISFDGMLFTWGFNPSGQLGIGSDRPTNDPINVLKDTRLVACGTHSTIAITGGKPEILQGINQKNLKKRAPSLSVIRSNSLRAEIQN
jgi:hypothetical protein